MVFIIDKLLQLLSLGALILLKAPPILISTLISTAQTLAGLTLLNTLDVTIFVLNCFLPLKPKGKVVAEGNPGYGGLWPEFQAPNSNFDSRSPCPYLSASLLPSSSDCVSRARTDPRFSTSIHTCIVQMHSRTTESSIVPAATSQ